MSTFMAKPHEVERKWYVIDAAGKTLGRVATEAARLLRGKHKPIFTPHVDTGDYVIIINAAKVRLTGNKLQKKQYIRHTGYPGGLRVMNYATLLRTFPERAVEKAVKGMIPHNSLGRKMVKKLKVYRGDSHPHAAQQPQVWEIKD
ncbi:50S ribosomal protein L13 [Neomoorella thermoacetica]|uniref:Large ribosomal subunit protein uL13 n=3 Tax=Neomoorella thermoacetica TaxID=1525 RepID=RL13_MOOTA|nr:50S ribosomal protein L13 [Moorella thermoacetica]Q2RFT2.1 RecName: Full=Large ribosomal subunit protein uL13; AltName: Full=50S ribosomal protein L13 [Moorella thermoacetica ATCC 39073]AKX95285.1 50S ribosomal protein L13 [Moorella thermoacetica]AKX97910.1 50S ribosomal protein L13 [Moorella thermoacetica]AOQ25399.1 50S ribosomal protein L13 [Moorella thermoacetica]APC09623.1 50S ribosomal protein L13 [Moorella thermoacetica]OIQ10089.1 50S ribosomal protein L13 [Moorella thermoacetica]